MKKADRQCGRCDDVRSFIDALYGPELHAKRVDSLAGATFGVMTAASLAVAMIGHALAQARGLVLLLAAGSEPAWERPAAALADQPAALESWPTQLVSLRRTVLP